MKILEGLCRVFDGINEHLGRTAMWLAVGMVLVQFIVVVMRYVFGTSLIIMQESIIYMHATLFMVGAGYTLLYDGHVRVDIFYSEASPRKKAWIDLLATVFWLIPACLTFLWVSWPFVSMSWMAKEGTLYVGGIPAIYLLKILILVFPSLILFQGLSLASHSVLVLTGRETRLYADKRGRRAV